MPIVYWGIGWFAGLWLASVSGLSLLTWLVIGAVGGTGAVLFGRQARARLMLLCLCALGWGAARYTAAVPQINNTHIATYNGTANVTLTGLVVDEPDVRDRVVNLRLAVDTITLPDGSSQAVSGLVLARTFRFPVIAYGARVEVKGNLAAPLDQGDFNYKEYLARQGIHTLVNLPTLTVLAENQGSSLYQAIFAFKGQAQATINRLFPEPQASLLAGILLGNDTGIPKGLNDAFRITGMSHIIAISGFNIAILIAILVALSEPFSSRQGAVVFAIAGVSLYTLLVGADASVVRAALMGSVYLIGSRLLGRPNFAYASLFLAGFIMTLVHPLTLWDVGFQFSFTATLGLMLYAEPFTRWTRLQLSRRLDISIVNRVMGFLTEAVIVTLAAQILTWPLTVLYFKQFSLISLLANALILPAQPGVMVWGGLATLTGLLVPAVGQLFAWVGWLFLSYTTTLVSMLGRIPGAAVPVHISTAGVIAIYGLIAATTWLAQQEPAARAEIFSAARHNFLPRAALGLSLATALLTVSWGVTQPDGKLHVVFIDVGQGDATFIQTPSGRQILVDGGLQPNILNDQLGRQMAFWDREIDVVVATHSDADHVAGLPGVFDRYRVGRLITDGEEMGVSDPYDAVLAAAEAAATPLHRALAGEVITIEDGVRLEIIHPTETPDAENRNNNSVSIRLVYGDFSLLLTGDAEQEAERAMLARGRPLAALVFKAGHHGSNSSSTGPFLQAVRPQIIIVSSGKDNNFGHPHAAMLQRARDIGAAILRTDELGTIEVITDGRAMWWQAGP